MSNQRQIATTIQAYATDYNGLMPPVIVDNDRDGAADVGTGTGGHNLYFPDLLIAYTSMQEHFFGPLGYRWQNNIFDCPAYDYDTPTYGVLFAFTPTTNGFTPTRVSGDAELNDPRNNCQQMNKLTSSTALLFDGSMAADPRRAFTYAYPNKTIGGAYWYGNDWNETALYNWTDWPLRHNQALNWLFADAHAETRPWRPTNATDNTAEFNNAWQSR